MAKINAFIPIKTWVDVAEAMSAYIEIRDSASVVLDKDDKYLASVINLLAEKKISTWRGFAKIRIVYKKNMSATMCSTWAVCQELLGNLRAQECGGIWRFEIDENQIRKLGEEDVGLRISVREIFADLQKNIRANFLL